MKPFSPLLASCLLASTAHAQVTLIDATFEGIANDTNNTIGNTLLVEP